LLTLSRVIVALGDPSQTHINFRDSKLTRILQPSLSGNARMAIICCATPSELYLEETRSTLSFASRAKLVKTNAKVNEVLDDQSLIRRLQRELAVAKRSISGDTNHQNEQLQALATEAANAGKERHEALEKLKRLQRSILNSNALFESKSISTDSKSNDLRRRKRRRSDSAFQPDRSFLKASLTSRPLTPKYEPLKTTTGEAHVTLLSPKAELDLVRQALVVKGNQSQAWQDIVSKRSYELEITQSKLTAVEWNRNEVQDSLIESQIHVGVLKDQLNDLQNSYDNVVLEKEKLIELLDDEQTSNKKLLLEITNIQSSKDLIQSVFDKEKADMEAIIKDFRFQIDSMLSDFKSKEKILEERLVDKDSELQNTKNREKSLSEENLRIAFQFAQLMVEKDSLQKERDDDKAKIQKLGGEVSLLMGTMKDACQEKDELRAQIQMLSESCKKESAEKEAIKTDLQATTEKFDSIKKSLQSENSQYKSFIKQMQCEMEDIKSELSKKDICLVENIKALEEVKASCDQLKSDATVKEREYTNIQQEQERKIHDLISDVDELLKTISEKEEELVQATQTIESLTVQHTTLQSLAQSKDTAIQDLTREMNNAKMHTSVLESHAAKQAETHEQLRCEYEESMKAFEQQVARLLQEIDDLKVAVSTKENAVVDAQYSIEALNLEVQKAKSLISEKDTFIERLDNENHSMQERLQELECQIISKEEALTNLQCQAADLLNQLSDAQSKLSEQTGFIDQLQLDQEKSVSDLENKIIDLAKDITDLQATIESKEDVIRAQMLSIEALQKDIASQQAVVDENEFAVMNLLREKNEIQKELSLEKKKYVQDQIDSQVVSQNKLTDELARYRDLSDSMTLDNQSNVKLIESLKYKLAVLEKQRDDLSQLLSVSNESIREARQAAFEADEELDLKERKLEEVLNRLSEREEELSIVNEQLVHMQHQNKSMDGDLTDKVKGLIDENSRLQLALSHSLDDRKSCEMEYKRKMGEEQRQLIKEAEAEMIALRTARDHLKSALSQSESDAIIAKQKLDNLSLSNKRLESKYSDTRKVIDKLESELSTLKFSYTELSSEKEQMVITMSGLKQKLAEFDLKANEEVSQLALELKRSKSKAFEARQRMLDLEDYVRNLESQGKMISEELEEEKKYRISLESKILSLQGEMKNLRLGKLEEKHYVANENVLAEMKEKLKDLNQELLKKDSRIKKLEAVRLTREQCAALKKIKVRLS
jgi:chromosome segregation ATPase